jgi:carboxypeptidase C (cathepsin A)
LAERLALEQPFEGWMSSKFSLISVRTLALLLALLVAGAAPGALMAQERASQRASGAPKAAAADRAELTRQFPPDAVSRRELVRGERRLPYTATAGSLPLTNAKGEVTANIFSTAYTLDDRSADRPITFVFNGGPGAASAYLHLGALGPRVVNFTADGAAAVQPPTLADNPDTWLDFTDLVFVDPVATGYSRSAPASEEGDKAFFGVAKDADAMADFVRLYLTRAGRSLAPVFLVGESYGGLRAALLADRLSSGGVPVKGAVLVSPALELSLLRGNAYALLPVALALPSIAATHLEKKDGVEGSLASLREVEQFARTRYLLHMAAGLKADPEIDKALAGYTGLARDVINRNYSRVSVHTFTREYEKDGERVLSRYDATVGAPVPRRGEVRFDPILDRSVTVLGPAFMQYARTELGYRTDLEYRLLNREVSGRWDFGAGRQGYAGAVAELQKARARNPTLGVLITHGYTDLVTPYAVSQYLVDQLAPIDGARAIELKVYRGGHMMYLRPASRRALSEDARAFYASVLGG